MAYQKSNWNRFRAFTKFNKVRRDVCKKKIKTKQKTLFLWIMLAIEMAEWLKSHTNEKQVNDWLLVFNMNANIKSISNDSDDKLITKGEPWRCGNGIWWPCVERRAQWPPVKTTDLGLFNSLLLLTDGDIGEYTCSQAGGWVGLLGGQREGCRRRNGASRTTSTRCFLV